MLNIKKTVKKTAFLGLMLALIVTLSALESFLPPIGPIGAVKPGLSNIIIMYILFFTGEKEAVTTACLKSLFVFVTRGSMAFALSLSGGLLSIFVMVAIKKTFKSRTSYLILSVFGGIFHNVGQITALCIILKTAAFFYWLPFFVFMGIVMGCVTGVSLKYILPALIPLGS